MTFVKLTEDYLKLTKVEELNYAEIILLCKIVSLSNNDNNACTASNRYFAELMCTTERNLQRYMKSLKDAEVIKTFEEKEGRMTTTRFIYPQYTKINSLIEEYDELHKVVVEGHDNSDTCYEVESEGHDNFGSSTRQNWYEHTTELVEGHDNSDTLIIEEKRKEEKKRDKAAKAANTAVADDKWIPKDDNSNEIFGSNTHTDIRVMEIVRDELSTKNCWGVFPTPEDVSKDYCFFDCNKELIVEYGNYIRGLN